VGAVDRRQAGVVDVAAETDCFADAQVMRGCLQHGSQWPVADDR